MISLICGILKYGTDDPILKKKTKKPKTKADHGQGEHTWGSKRGKGREWNGWAFWGIFGCKLVYLEWMGSGALL